MLALRFSPSKIYAANYILAEFHRSHKKPTLEMIQPNLAILAQFRCQNRILQLIPHKKKSWGGIIYEKNLAVQDTVNLATGVGFGYCLLVA